MAKTGHDGTEQVLGSEVEKMRPGKLKKLLKEQRAGQNDMDEIRGSMGSAIATAVEKDNLDKKMFGWLKQLDRMTPEKLAYHLPNLFYMIDASGIGDRAQQAQKLALEQPDDDEDEDKPPRARNVTPMRAPTSVAAE